MKYDQAMKAAVTFPDELMRRVDDRAKQLKWSRSMLLQKAVEKYLQHDDQQTPAERNDDIARKEDARRHPWKDLEPW
jgi:metal-responsive CopG/Arc/MetJ family transcriptional regulator